MDHTFNCLDNQIHVNVVEVTLEDELEPYPYWGTTKEKPKALFNPCIDILLNDFVLCCLGD